MLSKGWLSMGLSWIDLKKNYIFFANKNRTSPMPSYFQYPTAGGGFGTLADVEHVGCPSPAKTVQRKADAESLILFCLYMSSFLRQIMAYVLTIHSMTLPGSNWLTSHHLPRLFFWAVSMRPCNDKRHA